MWLCSAILYIVLSSKFGAREKLPELPEEESPAPETETVPANPVRSKMPEPSAPPTGTSNGANSQERAGPAKKSQIYYISGLIALASLAVSLGLSICVAASGEDVYTGRFEQCDGNLFYLRHNLDLLEREK